MEVQYNIISTLSKEKIVKVWYTSIRTNQYS